MKVRYNVIKEPKVGDGPSRLLGRFETRDEAEAAVEKELQREENQHWTYLIDEDDSIQD